MKRILLALLVVFTFCAQAFELTQENRQEIDACWRRIFGEEMLKFQSQDKVRELKDYRKHLLDIQEDDMQAAGQLVARLCKGDLWDVFVAEKSLDAILDYIDYLIDALNLSIGQDAAFTFPLRLQEIHTYVSDRGCDVQEVCTKMRQAFLAFTIIVSKMDYLARQ